ncbi:hypothetical protein Tco_0617541 [Tanacetum coccineum]
MTKNDIFLDSKLVHLYLKDTRSDLPRFCVKHIHENMKLQFRGSAYKDMIWKANKTNTLVDLNKKMDELKSYNSAAYDWLIKIPAEQWSISYFSGRAKRDILLNNICEVFNRQKWDLTGIPCKHAVAAIHNMFENGKGVNLCNGSDMWLVIQSPTILILHIHKTPVGRPPKKRKKKAYRGQGGASQAASSSQQSAILSQAVSRNGLSQVSGARNDSSQAPDSS